MHVYRLHTSHREAERVFILQFSYHVQVSCVDLQLRGTAHCISLNVEINNFWGLSAHSKVCVTSSIYRIHDSLSETKVSGVCGQSAWFYVEFASKH